MGGWARKVSQDSGVVRVKKKSGWAAGPVRCHKKRSGEG